MDENPDNITVETAQGSVSLINFGKRKMVYNVISLVQQYPPSFMVREEERRRGERERRRGERRGKRRGWRRG